MENSILCPDEVERSEPAIYPFQNCIFTVSIIFFYLLIKFKPFLTCLKLLWSQTQLNYLFFLSSRIAFSMSILLLKSSYVL